MNLLVMAKAPVAGAVKTRLCPPLTHDEAAVVARAALLDTLDAVGGCRATRRVVALHGEPGDWLPSGFEVIAQRGRTFAERLANAWLDCGAPTLQIGMDTPQVTPGILDAALAALQAAATGAVLGLAADGGWWALGLAAVDATVFDGVPMSTSGTGAAQQAALAERGRPPVLLPTLRDVDDWADALAVAQALPGGLFAAVVRNLAAGSAGTSGSLCAATADRHPPARFEATS